MPKFSELPVGSKVYIGMNPFLPERQMIWVKANSEGDLICWSRLTDLNFDVKEPESTSRDRRERGSNFFPESNLFQYLNSSGADWFVPASETDVKPWYADKLPGFLSAFTPHEKNLMETKTVVCKTPSGYKQKYGQTTSIQCKVSLPAASELSDLVTDSDEGAIFQLFSGAGCSRESPENFWTRTAASSSVLLYVPVAAALTGTPARASSCIAPVLRLKGNTEIEDYPDEFGVYYIFNAPQGMSLDDILNF